MPSFHLSPEQIAGFRCLPGRALLRVLPAEQKIGSIHLPETAAEAHQQRQPVREGEVVKIDTRPHRTKELRTQLGLAERFMCSAGVKVLYLTHADEIDNQYVVVLHGQIVAVLCGEDKH